MTRSRRQLVVCGTDTDVGKTVVSALVVQGLGAHYWKPVQSGLEGGGDTGRLQALLQLWRRPTACGRRFRPTGPPSAKVSGSIRPGWPCRR